MTDQEIQSAITNGLAAGLKPFEMRIAALETARARGAEADSTRLDENTLTQAIARAMEPFSMELQTLKDADLNQRLAQARLAVKAHIDRGAIAPEEKLPSGKLVSDYYQEQYLANAADAEAAMRKLPGRNLGRMIYGAGRGITATAGAAGLSPQENSILDGARKLRTENKAIASDALAIEAYLRTAEGMAAYREIHDQRVDAARRVY